MQPLTVTSTMASTTSHLFVIGLSLFPALPRVVRSGAQARSPGNDDQPLPSPAFGPAAAGKRESCRRQVALTPQTLALAAIAELHTQKAMTRAVKQNNCG
jgi:hypothetical protein